MHLAFFSNISRHLASTNLASIIGRNLYNPFKHTNFYVFFTSAPVKNLTISTSK